MSTYCRTIVVFFASAFLTACAHTELIRSSSQRPSPSMDHCRVCMDLGQAWALFRMGAYEQADDYCKWVIEGETDMDGKHVRRARDIGFLSKGFMALRDKNPAEALALFDEISDPELRELGQPRVDLQGRSPASADGAYAECPSSRTRALSRSTPIAFTRRLM